MMIRKLLSILGVLVFAAAARGQVTIDAAGTTATTFKVDATSATPLTLSNAAGSLSLSGMTFSGQLTSTVSTGTAPFVISSTTKSTNMHADQVDGLSLAADISNGGVAYQSSTSQWTAIAPGTSGQFLRSGGTGAPTWIGLNSAQIFVGNVSNVPAAVALSGDATLDNAGVMTLSANSVNTTEITNAAVTAAKLASAVEDMIVTLSGAAGAEAGDAIAVTIQAKDANANTLSGLRMAHITISDSATALSATSQSPTIAYTTGVQWQVATANKREVAGTDSNGTLVFSVTLTGDVTVYAHVAIGDVLVTVTLDFN